MTSPALYQRHLWSKGDRCPRGHQTKHVGTWTPDKTRRHQ